MSAGASAPTSELERLAEAWIADHPTARHLVRTRDWALRLEPAARLALRIAALTHDIERAVPGGPVPLFRDWDDPDYLRTHSERSAAIVSEWLDARGAPVALRGDVAALVRAHETGGWAEADVLQSADSLSFLEVNPPRVIAWVREGRCDEATGRAKLDWMRDRIALAQAQSLAAPLHAQAVAALDAAISERGDG